MTLAVRKLDLHYTFIIQFSISRSEHKEARRNDLSKRKWNLAKSGASSVMKTTRHLSLKNNDPSCKKAIYLIYPLIFYLFFLCLLLFFFIGNKDYIQEHYLMQKNIRQREKYKGKRKSVKTKKRKDTKYIEGS